MKIAVNQRKFVDTNLKIESWSDIEPYFDQLIQTEINSKEDFAQWLENISELDAVLEEELGWRYIKMTVNTGDEEAAKSYSNFIQNINPSIAEATNKINTKIYHSRFKDDLLDPGEIIIFQP